MFGQGAQARMTNLSVESKRMSKEFLTSVNGNARVVSLCRELFEFQSFLLDKSQSPENILDLDVLFLFLDK